MQPGSKDCEIAEDTANEGTVVDTTANNTEDRTLDAQKRHQSCNSQPGEMG